MIANVELMKILIENSSKENEIVFEPFMVVGATCIASLLSNRQYIGVELDENYFKISEERFEKELYEKNNMQKLQPESECQKFADHCLKYFDKKQL